MRLMIWLALPIGMLAAVTSLTVLMAMAGGRGYCGTWLSVILPYCG